VHLPSPLLVETIRHCTANHPKEACGLLLGRRSEAGIYVRQAVVCANQLATTEQAGGFSIDALELLRIELAASNSGEQVVGLYHSHCDTPARPSAADYAAARHWPDLLWLIVSTSSSGATDYSAWWPGERGLSKVPMTQPPAPSVLLSAGP
jgi:proteasome lid subunit RPN8/RPN11